ncbi:TPA: TniQ family protein [Burkholderia vietnamiensis]|uniref:TniQ family protein n=1 Tax=Burkholderia vietnamiensis TaxID=60552 RepID=UPI00158979F9|nr:TniQ family protein [Burkholderia vietnamiensis]MBR8162240.1 TniQ family protein [Burkholderia vietnamiensis]MCA8144844.1 TniQ family protein [Burkholderia vietnamiensis]MEC4595661.1 TniQ family protein [Burkholderia vietnamiensis]HDR8946726.1 TniQ family protein [Burkholderia vietnamiensis]HDR9005838.1 TniQ family protein [Burkholderia vietnamiensis]
MTTPLLLSVAPHRGESLSSLLHRVAEVNGLSGPGMVLRRAGVAAFRPRFASEADALASVCRLSSKLVRAMTPLTVGAIDRNGTKRLKISFYGHWVEPDSILVGANERICPACIAEHKHTLGVSAYVFATSCAVHGVRLLDRCPNCKRDVSPMRPSLARCQCGSELGSATCQPAEASEMLIARLIDRRWRMSFERDVPRCPLDVPPDFSALDLGELLRVLSFLYRVSGATSGSTDKGLRSKAIDELGPRMQKIGRVLMDWPDGFAELVNAERQYPTRSKSLVDSARSVEHISFRLFSELPEPQFAFLHHALVDAIGRNVSRAA